MKTVEDYEKIRKAYYVERLSIRAISRQMRYSRKLIRQALEDAEPKGYQQKGARQAPVLGSYHARIEELLEDSEKMPRKQRYTAHKIYQLVQAEGYRGCESNVHTYVSQKRRARKPRSAYLPLEFDIGQDAQVDWGEAQAEINGMRQAVQMFVMRLNYSKARFVVAFPFQKQEAFFEGHIQAFHFFGGVPRRITYDNLKTAVFRILEGHHRQEQRAFSAFRSHYLFESHYCTPAQGHEKGGVESDVGYAQRNFFAPIPKAKDFAELNAVLHQVCLNDMQRSVRGENRTVAALVSSFELLSIPLVLGNSVGIDTMATYLYTIGVVGVNKDQGAVAAVAVLIVLLVTGLVYLQTKLVSLERRFVTVGGKATRPKAIDLGVWKGIVSFFVGLYVVLGIILPLGCIVLTSFVPFLSPFMNPLKMLTLKNYQGIFNSPAYFQSIVNSINISIFAAGIGIVFMAVAALIAYRSAFKYRNAVKYMALYPRAFPGIIVGIGFLWAFLLVPGLGSLRNTIIAISIAFIMRYLPLGFSAVSPAVLQVSDELDRAGRVAGATWLGTIRHILLPILKPALVSGYILLAISFLKEYSTALFLVAEGSRVIGTTMLELWKQGGAEPVAALSTIQMAITAVLIIGARKLMGVKLHE